MQPMPSLLLQAAQTSVDAIQSIVKENHGCRPMFLMYKVCTPPPPTRITYRCAATSDRCSALSRAQDGKQVATVEGANAPELRDGITNNVPKGLKGEEEEAA